MIVVALILTPALAAVAGLAVSRNDLLARIVSIGSAVVGVAIAIAAWVDSYQPRVLSGPGLATGEVRVPLDLATDPTRGAISAVVALVVLAVAIHAAWYLELDDRYPQFAATVSLFAAAMLLLVQSSDLVLTLVGWEVMGWCSYLLIGHWSRRAAVRRASMKAFLVTRGADVFFVLGIVGLAVGARSTGITDVIAAWDRPTECIDGLLGEGTGLGEALAACAAPDAQHRAILLSLLVIGILGKSAQVPFQDWLIDAMEGPTPASALIHAATMVAAGTVVLGSVYPIYADSPSARWVLGLVTSITMLFAALMAFAQSDLKRLLAWSTVSQVAIMLAAVAAAAPREGADAGLFYLWSHAIFKALLFLGIGWASLIAGGTAAATLRGSATASPLLRLVFAFGFLSLAGVPLVVGGLAKEHVLAASWDGALEGGPGLLVLVAVVVTAAVTAAYCTRGYLVLTALVRPRPSRGTVPLDVRLMFLGLTVLSAVGGFVLATGSFVMPPASLWWIVLTVLVIAVGVGVALVGGLDRDPAQVLASRFIPAADRGLGVDAVYVRAVARPILGLARLVATTDTRVVDAYARGSRSLTVAAGRSLSALSRGERPSAGVALVLGAAIVVGALAVLSAAGIPLLSGLFAGSGAP